LRNLYFSVAHRCTQLRKLSLPTKSLHVDVRAKGASHFALRTDAMVIGFLAPRPRGWALVNVASTGGSVRREFPRARQRARASRLDVRGLGIFLA